MHNWVENLLEVQRIDIRMAKLQAQFDSVPGDKAAAEGLLHGDEQRLAAAREAVQTLEKELKSIELDVEGLKGKKTGIQSKSAMIKNNEEYRAAMHQIEQYDHQIAQLEDRELEVMDAIEKARTAQAECLRVLDVTKRRVAEVRGDLDKRLAGSKAALDEMAKIRQPALAAVDAQAAQRYERLRSSGRSRNGQAVLVPIRDEVCGRCRMNVTAQLRMNALKGMPVTCQNCGAMLYSED
jgi:predicted  nucleic acid-binding Zn-ribbon protein